MTDIEKKALALWGPKVTAEVNLHNFSILGTAFLEMRERHEAFRQEVSDAIEDRALTPAAEARLSRFIITKPDPLVDVWLEAFPGNHVDDARDECAKISEALAKRGGKIVWDSE